MNNSPDRLRCVPLLSMNRGDSAAFSCKVAEAGRVLPVYVHPNFADRTEFTEKPSYRAYLTQRDSETTSLLEANAPLTVFHATERRQPSPIIAGRGTIYVIGTPLLRDVPWDIVGRILHNAGVEEIQIGGVFTQLCVSKTMEELTAQRFHVTPTLASLSSLAAIE